MEKILSYFRNRGRQAFVRLAAVVILLGTTFGSSAMLASVMAQQPAPRPKTPNSAPYNIFMPSVANYTANALANLRAKPKALPVTITTSPCPVVGTAQQCDVYAMTGTVALPDGATTASVPIWGFASSATGPAALPGATLVVTAGQAVNITLHNVNIPSAVSLAVSQAPLIPDTTGVTAGGSTTYSFSATGLNPGTYLYEAGLTADGPREAAMGLYGALIVRPAATTCASCAYDANSTFVDESLLVLSEVDPAFNAAPLTFDMSGYAPKYWLINGAPYTAAAPTIGTTAGDSLLLRYVNAGLLPHSMDLLGLHQAIVGTDAKPETNQLSIVAETIPAGGSLDTIVNVPLTAASGARYPLFDGAMHLDNNGQNVAVANPNPAYTPIASGGMLTFITVAGNLVANGGPVASNVNVAVTPAAAPGTTPVTLGPGTLSATLTSAAANVTAAEYFVDLVGANGTGTAMTGTFGGATAAVSASFDASTLAAGMHTLFVNGQDSNGLWGPVGAAVFFLDKNGPDVVDGLVTPGVTNGLSRVTDSGKVTSSTTTTLVDSSKAWTAGEWATYQVTIIAGTGLGQTASITTNDATSLTVSPSWTTPLDTTSQYAIQGGVEVQATGTDIVTSNLPIHAAEYFIGTTAPTGAGGTGTPFVFTPDQGSIQSLDIVIPPTTVQALADGSYNVYVRAQDTLGVWGPFTALALNVDRTGPATSSLVVLPNPTNGQTGIQNNSIGGLFEVITANFSDPLTGGVDSNIAGAEYFIDTTGPNGSGGVMLSNSAMWNSPSLSGYGFVPLFAIQALSAGSHTFYVHAQDAAGNWGPFATAVLVVDKVDPITADLQANPNPVTGAAAVNLSATFNNVVLGVPGVVSQIITGAEYFIDGGAHTNGTGTAFTGAFGSPNVSGKAVISATTIGGLTTGSHTIYVHAKNASNVWGPFATIILVKN